MAFIHYQVRTSCTWHFDVHQPLAYSSPTCDEAWRNTLTPLLGCPQTETPLQKSFDLKQLDLDAIFHIVGGASKFPTCFPKFSCVLTFYSIKQECIPVGCVPPAHWPYLVVSAMHAPCHTCPPAMHAPLLPCMPPPHHACPLPRMPPAMHAPLWTEFLTHASENITLPQLRCGW